MTQTAPMVGTMEYMSPEQALGSDLDRVPICSPWLSFFTNCWSGRVPYKADTAVGQPLKADSRACCSGRQPGSVYTAVT